MATPNKSKPDENKIPPGVKKLLGDAKQNSIDSSVFLGDLIACWGGPFRLARDVYEEFQFQPKGSMQRARTMEMIQRLIMNNTQHELTNVRKPGDCTDAELELETEKLIAKALRMESNAIQAPSASGAD